MLLKTMRFAVLIAGMCFVTVFCGQSISSAQSAQPINGVGFASMEKFSFDSPVWNNNFSTLAKQSYLMKYSSFKQVAEKLQMNDLRPLTLEIPGDKLVLPANTKTVRKFHEQFNDRGDRYLRNIALANNAALVVFDYVEKFDVQRYIEQQIDNFVVTVIVYYLDSNAMGLTHIPIQRDDFSKTRIDYNGLKAKIHRAILEALEDAVINTQGIISGNLGADGQKKNGKPHADNGSGESSGPEQSGPIEDSHMSEQEKSSFWE
ncbi:MAG: hypothetical protein ACQERN_04825 [Thermodesulfobacteriota bacterium]